MKINYLHCAGLVCLSIVTYYLSKQLAITTPFEGALVLAACFALGFGYGMVFPIVEFTHE